MERRGRSPPPGRGPRDRGPRYEERERRRSRSPLDRGYGRDRSPPGGYGRRRRDDDPFFARLCVLGCWGHSVCCSTWQPTACMALQPAPAMHVALPHCACSMIWVAVASLLHCCAVTGLRLHLVEVLVEAALTAITTAPTAGARHMLSQGHVWVCRGVWPASGCAA